MASETTPGKQSAEAMPRAEAPKSAARSRTAKNTGSAETTKPRKTRKPGKSRKPRKKQKKQAITFNISRDEALIFRAYAKSQGKTVRSLLVEFIRACNKSFPGADAVLKDPAAEQISFYDFGEEASDDSEDTEQASAAGSPL